MNQSENEMNKKLMLILATLGLTACGTTEELPNPSAAQEQAAWEAYEDLKDGQYQDFLQHLTPELQQHFASNEKMMRKFSHSIPKVESKSKTLMK